MLAIICRKRLVVLVTVLLVFIALVYDTRFFSSHHPSPTGASTFEDHQEPVNIPTQNNTTPIIDVISIGSLQRPHYQQAQQQTFGKHSSIRHFVSVTERDDFDPDCSSQLTWRDVQNISGFCGGLRQDIQHRHRLLYELKVKFAKPQWLERTKSNPAAWLCAQKRPMAGFYSVVSKYSGSHGLPDFLILIDDDTYYSMDQVVPHLVQWQQQVQLQQNDNDDEDNSGMVVAGCVIRSRLHHFKWTFPFGGWGTIFNRGALEALLKPLYCNSTNDTSSWSARICPKLQKDRIGEYQVYQEGMSLADIMYTYVRREPYANHASWSLGFCLHSDWVWGCK